MLQDTVKSPPAEHRTMKKATVLSITITTVFYLLCGSMGYAAFGNNAPGNLLTGFGFYNPYWLLDIANFAIVVHLVGAYQVLLIHISYDYVNRCSILSIFNLTVSYLIYYSRYFLSHYLHLWRSGVHVSIQRMIL